MHGPRWGWHVLKAAKAIHLAEYRSSVHAFLDGVFTCQDIEEGVIPIPLVNLVEFRVRSSTMNDSWNTARSFLQFAWTDATYLTRTQYGNIYDQISVAALRPKRGNMAVQVSVLTIYTIRRFRMQQVKHIRPTTHVQPLGNPL